LKISVTLTLDKDLVGEITKIVEKVNGNRSDVINVLLWQQVQNLRANPPRDYGELLRIGLGTGKNVSVARESARE
jgi:metal-responsive CopG/Arc/MetJ family transcriptional regulator